MALSAYTLMVTLKHRLKALSPELKTGYHRRDQPERDRRLIHQSLSRFWGSKTTAAGALLQTDALLGGSAVDAPICLQSLFFPTREELKERASLRYKGMLFGACLPTTASASASRTEASDRRRAYRDAYAACPVTHDGWGCHFRTRSVTRALCLTPARLHAEVSSPTTGAVSASLSASSSNHIALRMAKAAARPRPSIHEKYHMSQLRFSRRHEDRRKCRRR